MDVPRNTTIAVWLFVFSLVLWSTHHVASQTDPPAFSLHVKRKNSNTPFNFDLNMLQRFYSCLCFASNTSLCIVDLTLDKVTDVRTCAESGNASQIAFTCGQTTSLLADLVCERKQDLGSFNSTCVQQPFTVEKNITKCPHVLIRWNSSQSVTVRSNSPSIHPVCENNCTSTNLIDLYSSLPASKPPVAGTTIKLTTSLMTSAFSTSTRNVRTTTTSFETSSADVTTSSTETVKDSGDDGKKEENESETIIIIGASISVIVIVAFIIIIVYIFWRRKKKSPSSTTTNNSNIEDQEDIYPYGDSTLNNTELNENPNIDTLIVNGDVNSNPTRLNPISSSGYEKPKVHIDPRYTSEGPQAKFNPESTTDGADFGGYEKAHLDVAYPYTTANLSIENNPTPTSESVSSNGYEEISPYSACQYTSENPAVNHKSTSSPEGVYAKLHESARNITNVYNESPASENTCAVDC